MTTSLHWLRHRWRTRTRNTPQCRISPDAVYCFAAQGDGSIRTVIRSDSEGWQWPLIDRDTGALQDTRAIALPKIPLFLHETGGSLILQTVGQEGGVGKSSFYKMSGDLRSTEWDLTFDGFVAATIISESLIVIEVPYAIARTPGGRSDRLHGFHPANGTVLWTIDPNYEILGYAYADGTVVTPEAGTQRVLRVYSAVTGRLLSESLLEDDITETSAMKVADGHLHYSSETYSVWLERPVGFLNKMALDSGEIVWRVEIDRSPLCIVHHHGTIVLYFLKQAICKRCRATMARTSGPVSPPLSG